ncbi:hypothetical protein [Sphingobium sp. YC-XJ3]|uniref:hypothetical protein n=1 Tax=Sphingobium sp. YC-XJ3 TaxID=3024245 RepID=UPI002361CA73|nr:hypothetical protein [Sphingobium sp. YC-XJ3]WDA36408.1 hypothetical protein PO876_23765 [Sphingobium sp. YC-XJ3]WDA37857.1 hypothetical protein PO876_06660 [Sphingobium sp. YC-XJ3]
MADFEDDTLELTEELETEQGGEEQQEEQTETTGEEAPEDEEEIVAIEGEDAPSSGEAETGLVKHLRDELRRVSRERDDLRKVAPQVKAIEVGEKPTLAGCDYDEERYETELDQWKGRKAAAEQQAEEAQKAQKQIADAWAEELQGHHQKKAALKFKDVQEAEDVALAALNDVQQAVIVKAAENSAMVIYALGKHPAKLAELSKITDPIKLAVAVSKLEGKMTVTKRGGPPEPERIARGGTPAAGGKDKELERLEKEAERTNDRTKLIAYKAKLKAQAK